MVLLFVYHSFRTAKGSDDMDRDDTDDDIDDDDDDDDTDNDDDDDDGEEEQEVCEEGQMEEEEDHEAGEEWHLLCMKPEETPQQEPRFGLAFWNDPIPEEVRSARLQLMMKREGFHFSSCIRSRDQTCHSI